jgi:hypothetical protein
LARLQSHSCPRVWIVLAEQSAASSSHIVAELPADREQRAELFKFGAELLTARDYEADVDCGQRYLYLRFDELE